MSLTVILNVLAIVTVSESGKYNTRIGNVSVYKYDGFLVERDDCVMLSMILIRSI